MAVEPMSNASPTSTSHLVDMWPGRRLANGIMSVIRIPRGKLRADVQLVRRVRLMAMMSVQVHSGYDGAPVELILPCGRERVQVIGEPEEWCQRDRNEDGKVWIEPDSRRPMKKIRSETGYTYRDGEN